VARACKTALFTTFGVHYMFSKLLNIGIHPDLDFYQKREVKILNLFALVTIFGLILGASNIIFIGANYPALVEAIVAAFMCLVFVFNYQGKYQSSNYTFVLAINGSILFINKYYNAHTGAYLFYFPLVFCIALLHNPKKRFYHTVVSFAIVLACFLLSQFDSMPFIHPQQFSREQNHILFTYNIFFTVIITVVLVFMIIRQLNTQYGDLTELLDKSKRDQVTITGSLREKEVLLAEVQHRVKNNLAVIIGLLNFQNESAESEETRNALREAKNRVMSIAMVHNQLYRKDDLTKINLNSYLSELITELLRSHPVFQATPINKYMQDIDLGITKTVPLGLMVNEVITNSFKHGFKDNKNPKIDLQLTKTDNIATLSISDNGIGFPPKEKINKQSLGLTLIESLTDQIDGKVQFSNSNGAKVEISFPLN
jgi:two-component sensor histidine kinase